MEILLAAFTIYLTNYFFVALAWLAGAIWAYMSRQRHPRISRLTLIALAIFFVESLASVYISVYMPFALRGQGSTSGGIQIWISLLTGFLSLMLAAAWGLIFFAIFGKRDQP